MHSVSLLELEHPEVELEMRQAVDSQETDGAQDIESAQAD